MHCLRPPGERWWRQCGGGDLTQQIVEVEKACGVGIFSGTPAVGVAIVNADEFHLCIWLKNARAAGPFAASDYRHGNEDRSRDIWI